MEDNKTNELSQRKTKRVIEIIKENKQLPINEIKRIVKKEFPEVNIDILIDIITTNGVLRENEKGEER